MFSLVANTIQKHRWFFNCKCTSEVRHSTHLYARSLLYNENINDPESDVVILGVAFPGHGKETDTEGIIEFLNKNGYTYPTVMDTEGELIYSYYITAYPTTYMIDRDGNIFGYVPGSMTRDIMDNIIEQTRNK